MKFYVFFFRFVVLRLISFARGAPPFVLPPAPLCHLLSALFHCNLPLLSLSPLPSLPPFAATHRTVSGSAGKLLHSFACFKDRLTYPAPLSHYIVLHFCPLSTICPACLQCWQEQGQQQQLDKTDYRKICKLKNFQHAEFCFFSFCFAMSVVWLGEGRYWGFRVSVCVCMGLCVCWMISRICDPIRFARANRIICLARRCSSTGLVLHSSPLPTLSLSLFALIKFYQFFLPCTDFLHFFALLFLLFFKRIKKSKRTVEKNCG